MATYGFDGNSKGRVQVYSSEDIDSKLDSLFFNNPNEVSGNSNQYTVNQLTWFGKLSKFSLMMSIPLGKSVKYSNIQGLAVQEIYVYDPDGTSLFMGLSLSDFAVTYTVDETLNVLNLHLSNKNGDPLSSGLIGEIIVAVYFKNFIIVSNRK